MHNYDLCMHKHQKSDNYNQDAKRFLNCGPGLTYWHMLQQLCWSCDLWNIWHGFNLDGAGFPIHVQYLLCGIMCVFLF